MKAWITKYALTKGIEEWDVKVDPATTKSPNFLSGPTPFASAWGEGQQWHRTRESAVEKANQMRDAKVKSMMKSIKRMESLTFYPKPTHNPSCEV